MNNNGKTKEFNLTYGQAIDQLTDGAYAESHDGMRMEWVGLQLMFTNIVGSTAKHTVKHDVQNRKWKIVKLRKKTTFLKAMAAINAGKTVIVNHFHWGEVKVTKDNFESVFKGGTLRMVMMETALKDGMDYFVEGAE